MDKEAKISLIEWHPVSTRIIVACFKTTIRNIVMIQCYAPNAVAEDAERQEYYVQLNEILKKQKKKDIIILGGDLNAKEMQRKNGGRFELLSQRQVKRYWVLRRKTKKTG